MIDNFYDKIFVSDTHLSTRRCNYNNLKNLFSNFYAPTFYLVGDIIDLWKLKTIGSWPDEHTEVLSELIQILQDNTKIKYVIGNHDEFFENFVGDFSNFTFMKEDIITINDKKILITHGHHFDLSIRYFKWLGILLTGVYDLLQKKGINTFSLSEYLQTHRSKINTFEKLILEYVKKKKLDGVICGHTHEPHLCIKNNLLYANTGDFVKNSSFITQKGNKLTLMAYENKEPIIIKEIEL